MNIGGKGMFEFTASIPIIFEFTVLILILFLFIGFLFKFKMLNWSKESDDSIIIYIPMIYDTELLEQKISEIGAKVL